MTKKIKEQVEEVEDYEGLDRSGLNIQQFMNDMRLFNEQITNRNLSKPTFDFGASIVTNYLLWLILGELTMLNDSLEED